MTTQYRRISVDVEHVVYIPPKERKTNTRRGRVRYEGTLRQRVNRPKRENGVGRSRTSVKAVWRRMNRHEKARFGGFKAFEQRWAR